MSGIISAIRGGPDSQPTIEKAIDSSMETGLPLYFLYVINLDFMRRTESSRIQVLSQEMHEMGEFILLQAAAKAEEKGVTAETVIRQGGVREQVIKLCQEIEADYVVMGRPASDSDQETDLFTIQQLSEFGQRIQNETDASLILAEIGPHDEE